MTLADNRVDRILVAIGGLDALGSWRTALGELALRVLQRTNLGQAFAGHFTKFPFASRQGAANVWVKPVMRVMVMP